MAVLLNGNESLTGPIDKDEFLRASGLVKM